MSDRTLCYIGVGSNIEPEARIPAALADLGRAPGVRLTGVSIFYRTPPVDAPGTPDFYNGVVELRTSLPVEELTRLLSEVESRHGRAPTRERNAPRTIDLDLLLYGSLQAQGPPATLPHPDITARSFVALPLLELAPELILPGGLGSLAALAERFDGGAHEPLADFSRDLARLVAPT